MFIMIFIALNLNIFINFLFIKLNKILLKNLYYNKNKFFFPVNKYKFFFTVNKNKIFFLKQLIDYDYFRKLKFNLY